MKFKYIYVLCKNLRYKDCSEPEAGAQNNSQLVK